MKHPALVRKLEGYRYDALYDRYFGRVTLVALLVLGNLLLLAYCIWRQQLSAAVMVVLGSASVAISVAIGDHFGSRLAQRKQAEEKATGQENAAGGDKAV